MCIFMLDGAVAGSMNGSYENPLGGVGAKPPSLMRPARALSESAGPLQRGNIFNKSESDSCEFSGVYASRMSPSMPCPISPPTAQ
ncbi:MAG: hypothetical protein DMG05_18345 [Acidobacteria bacterium]|nr:MAG: hypothetical protein DMG05_18345 [Acidobacteriota bacterium]